MREILNQQLLRNCLWALYKTYRCDLLQAFALMVSAKQNYEKNKKTRKTKISK